TLRSRISTPSMPWRSWCSCAWAPEVATMADKPAQVKCVVWDLDGTIWEGTLSEGGAGCLRQGVLETIHELDRRGIIQSIASKNDAPNAMKKLEEFGIADYFLCPQISWG